MQIIKKMELTVSEENDIREMINYNNLVSNTDLDISIDNSFNYSKEITTNFLVYKDAKLIAYANIFAPSDDAFEVQTMVLKDYERIKVNSNMIEHIKKEALTFKPKELLLVCDESSESGMNYIKKINATYKHSEFFMKLKENYIPKFENYMENLTFRKATILDLDTYVDVSKRVYKSSIENLRDRFSGLFNLSDRSFYILYENNSAIGIGSIVIENGKYILYGFGISELHRGRGYSKYFLNKIIEETKLVSSGNIFLEVDSKNEIAYSLYKKNGFEEIKKISYFNLDYK